MPLLLPTLRFHHPGATLSGTHTSVIRVKFLDTTYYSEYVLDLHRLVLLREIKLRGSMTAAARALSYSHSAISQQLSLLQREAGATLLERVGRNVRLTSVGEQLVRNTESILEAMEQAEAELAATHNRPHGTLRLAAFATISRAIVPGALSVLYRDHPNLEVYCELADPEDAASLLTSRQVDAVITDAFPGTSSRDGGGNDAVLLGTDTVRGYLPDPSYENDMELMRSVPWVMEPSVDASTQWALRMCRELGFEPRVVHVSTDLLFHLRLVESGHAAAFLPNMVVRESGSNLVPSSWLPTTRERGIHLLTRRGRASHPGVVALRSALIESFREFYK